MKKIFLAVLILSVVGSLAFSQPANCVSPTAKTSPFVIDGAGTFCFVVDCMGANINSWNTTAVQINGVDYTNKYADGIYTGGPWPAAMNGKYYIYYQGSYAWSHFEMVGACPSTGTAAPTTEVTAPPVTPEATQPPNLGQVWISPATQSVNGGANFTVQIHANTNGTAIGAFGFNISYDSALVSVNASIGSNGVQEIATGLNLTVNNDTTNKILKIAGFNTSGIAGGTDVSLLTINFTAASVSAVSTATLTLAVPTLADASGTTISITTPINATVTINPVNLPTAEITAVPPTPEVTAQVTTPPGVGQVWISPASQSVNASTSFTVQIHTNTGGTAVGAFGFNISYDSTLVSVNATIGSNGVQEIATGLNLTVNNDTANKVLKIAGFNTSGIAGSADLSMVTVNFTAAAPTTATTTTLTLAVPNLNDTNGTVIGTITPINGTVTINPVVQPTAEITAVPPTPEITAQVTTPPGVGQVWISPASQSVNASTNFTVQIHANTGGTAIGAFGFNISYDSTLVSVNATIGSNGVQEIATGLNLTVNNDTANKILKIAGFNTSGIAGSADLSMVTVNFTAGAPTSATTTTLTLAVPNLNDTVGAVIGVITPINGTVTINPVVQPTAEITAVPTDVPATPEITAEVTVEPPTPEITAVPTDVPATPEITAVPTDVPPTPEITVEITAAPTDVPPPGPGAAWVIPVTQSVANGTTGVKIVVHVNTGTSMLSAYGIDVTYNSAILGSPAVAAESTGFVSASNTATAGKIVVAGFDTTGKGPNTDLALYNVTFTAIGTGTSAIDLNNRSFVDPNTNPIGTKTATSGSITVN
jgi:hypothetical protein